MPSPPSATGISTATAPTSRTPRAIAAAAARAVSVPLKAFGAQTTTAGVIEVLRDRTAWEPMVRNHSGGGQNVAVTTRGLTAGLGVLYVAASTVLPLVLKTAPSDLDLYLWPQAETVVAGHPLLIYAANGNSLYMNDNGPLGLVPLVPIAALANSLGWAMSLTGRAALAGGVASLIVLLLAYQVVQFVAAARGNTKWSLGIAATVLLAPALWIAILDYGHIEQPVELCLVLFGITCALRHKNARSGIALGAAILARTIAGFCVIPLVLIALTRRQPRAATTIAVASLVTIAVGLTPFVLADAQATVHALITYRAGLPISGGSFWIVARDASWAGLVGSSDVSLGAAVAVALVAVTLWHRPSIGTTHAGVIGLVTVASCCVPLLAKSVFPYYLFEPYVFAVLWWLARPGTALNWRVVVPVLLTIDVFVVMAATTSPAGAAAAAASVTSSVLVAVCVALVTCDLFRAPDGVPAISVERDASRRRIPVAQDAH